MNGKSGNVKFHSIYILRYNESFPCSSRTGLEWPGSEMIDIKMKFFTDKTYFSLVMVVCGLVMIRLFFHFISALKIHKICLDPQFDEIFFIDISFLISNVLDGIIVRS